jgi:hypothetical protein
MTAPLTDAELDEMEHAILGDDILVGVVPRLVAEVRRLRDGGPVRATPDERLALVALKVFNRARAAERLAEAVDEYGDVENLSRPAAEALEAWRRAR